MEGDPNSQFWTRRPIRTSSSASTASSTTSSNSSILKPWILVLTLSILFLFFFPSKTFTSRVSNLKNGWDSLNFALVLFAILCAFLARNNTDDDKNISQPLPPPISTNRWFDGYADVPGPPPSDRIEQPIGRLRRSSSSYPDLRQPQWVPADEWRFSDDIAIYKKEPKWNHDSVPEYSGVKTIFVDRVQSPSPPPPPPPPVIWRRARPNPRIEIEPEIEEKREAVIIPPPPPPPARRRLRNPPPIKFQEETESVIPPPPPPAARRRLRNPSQIKFQEETESVIPPPPPETMPAVKGKKSHKRTNSGGKDLAGAIARFYQKKRKSAGRKRSYDDTHLYHSPPSPPTPPPPPPQKHVSVLNQLFHNKKERSKSKRVHTYDPPRPPPPPPRRGRPPVAPVMETRNVVEEEIIIYSVTSSPLRPPPPPPPPAAMFCPSPDVDTKADMFIARLHEGWRLEKMKSIKEKQKKKEIPVAGADPGGDRNA